MTLIGHDTSYAARIFRGVRTMLFPRPRPRIRPRRARVIAHRGTVAGAPENTIEGCERAIDQGADGVEIDLCITRDGHVVLWHDADPDSLVAIARQGGAEGRPFVPRVPDFGDPLRKRVTELTLDEVVTTHGYDPAGAVVRNMLRGGDGPDVGVAQLGDLTRWAANDPRARVLILDTKLGAVELSSVPAFAAALAEALTEAPALGEREIDLLTAHLEIFEALRTEMRRHPVLSTVELVPDFELPGVLDVSRELGARRVSIGDNPRRTWASTRDDVVEAVRAREDGELDWVLVWTANDETILRELGRLAVDAVLTDDIALARRVLDSEHDRHRALLRRREQARIKIPGDKVR